MFVVPGAVQQIEAHFIPEVMPPAVIIRPASTTRARLMRQAGAISARRSIGTFPGEKASVRSGSLRFVAASPSSSPILAYTQEPVQTLVSKVVWGNERMDSWRRQLYIS